VSLRCELLPEHNRLSKVDSTIPGEFVPTALLCREALGLLGASGQVSQAGADR
jgi:hypothetical protein